MGPQRNKILFLITKIKKQIQNGLFLYSLRNVLSTIGIDIGPYYWVKEGASMAQPPKIRDNADDYILEYLTLEDMEDIAKTEAATTVGDVVDEFKKGHRAIGLKHKSAIAAFMFIEFNDFIHKRRSFTLRENEAYLLNMYTYDRFRGKNLAPYLRYRSYELLKEQGIDTLYSITAYFNRSSLRFKNKLHAKNLKLYLYIVLFKKFYWNFLLKEYAE